MGAHKWTGWSDRKRKNQKFA